MTTNNSILAAALQYASRGLSVFPCRPAGKEPLIKDWTSLATTNLDQINKWWSEWPNANVAIATGSASGFFIVDLDTKHNGPEHMAELEGQNSPLPTTVEVTTGGGGKHIFFKTPANMSIKCQVGIIEGIDIRGDGGYIIAAPSKHSSGNRYQWVPGCALGEVDIADCPDWLLSKIVASATKNYRDPVAADLPINEGVRNSTLTSLAGSMRYRGMTQESIEAALLTENAQRCKPPLPDDEVLGIARSISRYSQAPKSYPLTELGNAERFVDSYGQYLRYCSSWGKWFVYDGKRWVKDDIGLVHQKYVQTIRQMIEEAASIEDEVKRAALRKWQKTSESAKAFRELVNHAKNLEGIAVLPCDLDKDKMLLNLENGTCNLVSGEVTPPQREHLITKLAPVMYDPEAKCPTWIAFLHKIMDGNEVIINFLQKVVGYTLTGDITEQCMFILYGDGSNGKSTFTNTIAAVLGEDYVKNTPTQTLMARKTEGIPNDVAALQGARMVIASEGEQGQRLAESQIKRMTGGDALTARFMRSEFFSFIPEFKIFYFTNHKPEIRGTDDGIWRRIRLIPFTVKIQDSEKDPDLLEKLRAELPGILNWALEGCLKWQDEGLGYPDEIRAATESYRAEMNVVKRFLDERCEGISGSRVRYSDLFEAFKNWCEVNREYVMPSNLFSQKLGELDLKPRRSGPGGATEVHGIRLIVTSDDVSELNHANASSAVSMLGIMIPPPQSATLEENTNSYEDF